MDSISKHLWHSRKKLVFCVILEETICILSNFKEKWQVWMTLNDLLEESLRVVIAINVNFGQSIVSGWLHKAF